MMAAKLKHMNHQYRRKGISAQDLMDLNQSYLNQYLGLKKEEVVEKFMQSFNTWLQSELQDKGYWHNPHDPEKHLTELAQVGTFAVFVYHGHLPEKYYELLRSHIQKRLIKVFNLKSFKGFHLEYVKAVQKCAHITSIKLCWGVAEGGGEKPIIKRRVEELQKTSLVEEDKVAEKNSDERELVGLIRRDFRRNLRQMRKDLEQSLIDKNFHEEARSLRKSRHRSEKKSRRGGRKRHHKNNKSRKERTLMSSKSTGGVVEIDGGSISTELESYDDDDGVINMLEKRRDLRAEPEVDMD